jgi:hypothetical protein
MSLQSLKKSDCSNFKIFTMRDEVVYGESEIAEDGSQMQKQDIHAKLYMVSKDSDSYLYLGSLNASHNATSGNVEFMVMLKSKTDYLNLQSLKESILGGKDSPELFKEVTLDDNRKEETETDNILDSYIKAVNRMEPSAVIKQNGEKHDVNITFKNYEKYIENDNYTVYISPLLVDKKEHISESVSFTALNLTQLSKFYRVSVSDGKTTVERVLVIPTEGLPKEREGAVAASIVNNRESFFQYVAFLLGDSPVTSALEYANNSNSFGGNKNENKTFMPALYEKMLKTAATNPEHFKEIDFLINSISDDGVIPEDFKNLYNIFKKVVKIRG